MKSTGSVLNDETFEAFICPCRLVADGVTDFHGETEWFTTPQRVEMLGKYARYASRFWGDPGLNTPLFGESAVAEALSRIKPQPLTTVRRTIPLEQWRATGYKMGKEAWWNPASCCWMVRWICLPRQPDGLPAPLGGQ